MINKKILLLNGPPSCGKDFAGKFILENFKEVTLDKFARVLKERTHALYGFPERAWDYYEDSKEIPTEDFFGLTPRQAYILVSETYFKPQHGKDIFGKILAKELDNCFKDLVVISDSGFPEEAQVLIEKYGAENVILVRVHRDGCDFSNDSRNYLYLNVCNIDIDNRGDETYLKEVEELVNGFINENYREAIPAARDLPNTKLSAAVIESVNQSQDMISRLMKGETLDEINNQNIDQEQADCKPAVSSGTFPEKPKKIDNDLQEKDYVFEDVVEGKPSLITRIRRVIGV